jgi:hypothetical protein
MRLPDNAIGITDINQYRECARRFGFGMDRHTELGERPEGEGPNNAYGSAIHEAIHAVEEGATDDDAIQHAFERYGKWLEPDDLERLKTDLATYHERDYLGVKTVASEGEYKVPLMTWACYECGGSGERDEAVFAEGESAKCEECNNGEITIYYRFKVDRLYQRLDSPADFLHIDYKSSRWPRTQAEVDGDTQMWAYNWAIHEIWPECERLEQVYDQLVHGPIYTRKSAEKRARIKAWLIKQATTILRDEKVEPDGLLEPKFNQWCACCEILTSCSVVPRISDWAQSKIKAQREAIEALDLGDTLVKADDLSRFVDLLDTAIDGKKALEAYEESVKDVLRALPKTTREELGWRLSDRSRNVWDPEALRAAQQLIGEPFFDLVTLAKKRLQEAEIPDEAKEAVMSLAAKRSSKPALMKAKR